MKTKSEIFRNRLTILILILLCFSALILLLPSASAISLKEIINQQLPVEAYPINSTYISSSPINPSIVLGYGTWIQIGQSEMIIGQNSTSLIYNTSDVTGGNYSVNLKVTDNQGNANSTSLNIISGNASISSSSLNNFPYIWKRIA